MNRHTIVALLGLSFFPMLMAGEQTTRFVTETYPVHTDVQREPLRVTFKLDTTSGEMWRYTKAGFVHVPVDPSWSPTELEWPRLGLKERQRRKEIQQKLHDIIIPEISFKSVPLPDALVALSEASRANDLEGRGVDIVLHAAPFHSEGVRSVPILFEARQVTLKDAVNILCNLADLRMRVQDGVVVMVPYNPPGGELVHRMFVVEPEAIERLRREQPALFAEEIPAAQRMDPWREFFEGLGMSWSDGTSVDYIPSIGRFDVKNTHAEVERFERVLRHLKSHPSHPGRFRLAPLADSVQALPTVLLLDTVTGDSWIYEIGSFVASFVDKVHDNVPDKARDKAWIG